MNFIQWLFPKYNARQLLSLAGVMQAASLVDSFANTGSSDSISYDRCLRALLNTNPEQETDVFGKNKEMKVGVNELVKFCDGTHQNQATIRYTIQILHLQKLLYKKSGMQQTIQSGLLHAQKQMQMYGIEDDNLTRNLADLYQTTISTLGFKIQIIGKHQFLQQDMIAAKVRLLLFSGVRFAFLWRQSGGHAHHLVTAKRTIGASARNITYKI